MSKPNIILIVLDTARAETVYSLLRRDELPGIEKFATNGQVYENAFSTSPWTLPSHASMFSGQRSSDHGTHAGSPRFNPDGPALAEILSGQGYDTVGISSNSWVSHEFGFDRGFRNLSMKWDRFWGGTDLSTISKAHGVDRLREIAKAVLTLDAPLTVANGIYAKTVAENRSDDGAEATTSRAVKWIRSRKSNTPYFFFLNYLEPHLPYEPPSAYTTADPTSVNQNPWEYLAGDTVMTTKDFEILHELYCDEIRYLDTQLSRIYDALKESGSLDDTAVFIVGDHGDNIGDHNLMDHQYSLHDTLLNVPLIAHYPGVFKTGSSEKLFELRDIYPTVVELSGGKTPKNGASTTTLRDSGRKMVFAEYRYPQPNMSALREKVTNLREDHHELNQTLRAVRTDEWKLIESEAGNIELYALSGGDQDAEDQDVSDRNASVVSELRQLMDDHSIPLARANQTDDINISAASEQRLADLGYI